MGLNMLDFPRPFPPPFPIASWWRDAGAYVTMFMTPIDTDYAHTPCVQQIKMQLDEVRLMSVFSCLSILGKSVLIVAFAAGLLTQFFPRCAFAFRTFSKVSATPVCLQHCIPLRVPKYICVHTCTIFLCFHVLYWPVSDRPVGSKI